MNNVPKEILNPGGILQELIDYIAENSAVSIPFFNVGAALTFLGSVCGQKIQTETGLRTNIYSIALGYSGTGKNAPFSTLPNILINTDAKSILGPTELTSSASILKWLSTENQRVSLLMLDEIGLLLSGIKNQFSHASDIPRILIKLFSSTDRGEIKGYATGDTIKIPWHHLSLYGASTPERFWESLTMGDVADGFLARILIWENHDDAQLPKNLIKFKRDKNLEKKINKVFRISNIQSQSRIPTPKTIPKSKEALRLFQKYSNIYHDLKNLHKKDQQGLPSIYGRCGEHVSKLALIHAVSNNITTVEVSSKSVKWAIKTIDYISEQTIKSIKTNMAENEIDRIKNKILNWVKDKGDSGTKLRDIQRGPGRGMLAKELKKIIESLILSDELLYTTRGRSKSYFYNNKLGD